MCLGVPVSVLAFVHEYKSYVSLNESKREKEMNKWNTHHVEVLYCQFVITNYGLKSQLHIDPKSQQSFQKKKKEKKESFKHKLVANNKMDKPNSIIVSLLIFHMCVAGWPKYDSHWSSLRTDEILLK